MASDLDKKIVAQLEYYFGDINLPRDKFMQEKIKEDEGWVTLEVLLTFGRLANLSKEAEVIAEAVKKAEGKLLEVSEDGSKIRRSTEFPIPEFNEEFRKKLMERTAYAKGFTKDETLDVIMTFLKTHGSVESCTMRTYLDRATKENKFKGSCFVIFTDQEQCKKFIEAESIKYKEVELIRKWQKDYIDEKHKEIEERKNKKNKKAEEQQKQEDEKITVKCAPNSVVFFDGIKTGENISREDIREKIEEITKSEINFIDYSKGLTEGHIRFSEENAAVEFHKALADGKLSVGDNELAFKLLEAEQLDEYLKKVAIAIKERRKNPPGGRFNRKRKGNFSHRGGRSKK